MTEEPPTEDQLKSILEYVGASEISKLVKGAKTELEAVKKLKENGENFQRPVVGFPLDFGIGYVANFGLDC